VTKECLGNFKNIQKDLEDRIHKILQLKKSFVSVPIPQLKNPTSEILKLITNTALLSEVSNYLGVLPILGEIKLWYSPNRVDHQTSSQYYHVDYADVRQVKFYLNIQDVTEESGPLTVINSKYSREVINAIYYQRFVKRSKPFRKGRLRDEFIDKIVGLDKERSLTGTSGSLVSVDTCNCLHRGSRVSPKDRLILMFQFYSSFTPMFPLKKEGRKQRWSHWVDNNNEEWRNLLFQY
jgi:hypothetical protein